MFTITRSGTFAANLIPGTPHCGLKDGRNSFKYECTLTITDEGRDSNGFVVNNEAFENYFTKEYAQPTGRSCEEMAYQAARAMFRLLGVRAAFCRHVNVKIWGIPTSYIEYEWKAPRKTRTVRRAASKPRTRRERIAA